MIKLLLQKPRYSMICKADEKSTLHKALSMASNNICPRTKARPLYAIFVLFTFCSLACAGLVTVEVEGVVNYYDLGGGITLDGSLHEGSVMHGVFTYDDEDDYFFSEGSVKKYPLRSISMTVGSYSFTHDLQSGELPYYFLGQANIATSGAPVFEGLFYDEGVLVDGSEMPYRGHMQVMKLFPSNWQDTGIFDWPPHFSELSMYDIERSFTVNMYGIVFIQGELTDLLVVPEPATLLLFAFGSFLLRKHRQSRTF